MAEQAALSDCPSAEALESKQKLSELWKTAKGLQQPTEQRIKKKAT